MDINSAKQAAQHLDVMSMLVGFGVLRTAELSAVAAIKPLPGLVVRRLKDRVKALQVAGKIDAPTLRLLAGYGRATFAWADEELPDSPGPEKMAAVLDRLAAVPYLGAVVRADRAGAQEILQAAYDSVKAEAKAETAAPGGKTDDPPAPPPAGPPSAAAPEASAPPK